MDIKKGKYYRFDGPNGFTVKALDNSYGATFRAVVVLQGDYLHEVGHISSAWSNTSFVESDLSEFLEEANKRYPMDSRYVSLGGDPEGVKGVGVSSVIYEAKIWYYNDELRGIDMGNYVVYNFCIDKWTEPINDQVDTEETLFEAEFDLTTDDGRLAYAKKYYPIGTKFKPILPIVVSGQTYDGIITSEYKPRIWVSDRGCNNGIEVSKIGLIYYERTNKWAEIIKEEESRVSVFAENDLFNMDTDEGRLAYAKKYYPIGTKVTNTIGERVRVEEIFFYEHHHIRLQIGDGLLYDGDNGKWAEIIKEETKEANMEKQKLSRQGLKEIHSVSCGYWQATLELFGTRNPFEDYIELTQQEVDKMFNACTKEQLPIVSKYLKQNDDGSVDVTNVSINIRVGGEYENKAFALHEDYNWEIKKDSFGFLCLIPTKKK